MKNRSLLSLMLGLLFNQVALCTVTVTSLTSGSTSTALNDYITASINPPARTLVILGIVASTAPNAQSPSSVTGNGGTWVEVEGKQFNTIASPAAKISSWRTMLNTPSAGPVTFHYPSAPNGAAWFVVYFDGVETSGSNGSGAVVQHLSNATNSNTAIGLTTLAFGDATNNAALMLVAVNNTSGVTPEAGWTELYDVNYSSPNYSLECSWRIGEDLSPTSTFSSGAAGAIAIEIKAAAATLNLISVSALDDE